MNIRRFLAGLTAAASEIHASDNKNPCSPPCVPGDESIMSRKEHGTSHTPVQENLRWGCDFKTGDRICNFNRHYAEHAGYFLETSFLDEESNGASEKNPVEFFDSNTGRLLFTAPRGRTWHEFIQESRHHGWPSFRLEEVNWDTVRVLPNGETVSVDGTHLGHDLPDEKGHRFCINLVSVAGNPLQDEAQRREFR